ncbi:polyprenyl synthetase family protein [Pseudoruegeria sp. HB172150]|uniref:polyprenyl synthetase family protein n=1 Tax=Pseudoruegeria sp. HB172150 TaxID=2721164 RepID=UPI00352CE04F
MNFETGLAERAASTRAFLDAYLEGDGRRNVVLAAMRHALAGGKGLRGYLVTESALVFGVGSASSAGAAAAIEAMHAYSLVHDDLPCMDDDDMRRGQPTVHVKWDEATAVLAGDALQTLAFELLAEMHAAPEVKLALIAGLARAAGHRGMVLGQAQDLAAEVAEVSLTLDEIVELQGNKTGALIEWSCEAGALLASSDPGPLRRYARAIGLAFQIADDILDVEGDSEAAGKRLRKDEAAGKATFVSLLGLDGAKARAAELVKEAEAALAEYGDAAENLREAARFVISRRT